MFTGKTKYFTKAFLDATLTLHGYSRNYKPNNIKMRTRIFPVYLSVVYTPATI